MLPTEILAAIIESAHEKGFNKRELMMCNKTIRSETLRILLRDLQFLQYSELKLSRALENINELLALYVRSIRIDSLDISEMQLEKLLSMSVYLKSLCVEDISTISPDCMRSVIKAHALNSFSLIEMNHKICSDQMLNDISRHLAGKRLQEFRFGVRQVPKVNMADNQLFHSEDLTQMLPGSFTLVMDHLVYIEKIAMDSKAPRFTENVSDILVDLLRKSPHLQKIEICGIPLKLNVLQELSRLKYLKQMCISHVTLVDDANHYLPSLLTIPCRKLEFILSDPPLPPLHIYSDINIAMNIREIDLSFSQIDNETARYLLKQSSVTRLHLLSCHNICGTELLDDYGKLIDFHSGKSFSINR